MWLSCQRRLNREVMWLSCQRRFNREVMWLSCQRPGRSCDWGVTQGLTGRACDRGSVSRIEFAWSRLTWHVPFCSTSLKVQIIESRMKRHLFLHWVLDMIFTLVIIRFCAPLPPAKILTHVIVNRNGILSTTVCLILGWSPLTVFQLNCCRKVDIISTKWNSN